MIAPEIILLNDPTRAASTSAPSRRSTASCARSPGRAAILFYFDRL
ncbi:MAG: hypothetical protein U1E17_04195 [Geminicoccaceae bacterium]